MLKIKRGSVFDEKCDLIVLPCSSSGSVTSWVKGEIEQNNLPYPSASPPYGQLRVLSTEARYTKADYVGYAASVNAKSTSSELVAIEQIALDLISFCKQNDCSIVNIPLLGTGAGSLDPVEVFSTYERLLGNENFIVNTYIPEKKIYQLISQRELPYRNRDDDLIEHPRVFISYSWKDDSVKNWVFELTKTLCANGVDARLDRFHLKPGMDLPQWMTNELIKAGKVLLVCDSHYAEKADMRKAGVGWETMIIQGDMMLQGEMNTKYIVIAYGDFEKNTPIYMKSKLGISKSEIDSDINSLLQHIFEIDTAPEIGEIPEWVKKKKKGAKI
ncbi:toll/interleukin-1 receptor domain-containing protein [Methylomonas sp. UP202]|uniref:toll/interleukin-1 receptor domain-containing protein n=1 Tax=Methylomonas sp. UP202 TaxID=3040943 RepID=UPI00247864BF|nr:toll/interleukin-1 receptor domain-containing protein [Methylomonas sp. UP202]WGS84329.1 toll/interleukin-1 receptor domain-containing protein [Methylomonas sp. UP202]